MLPHIGWPVVEADAENARSSQGSQTANISYFL
jgi:hypothetical protein